jgi:hypothetical protein
MEEDYGKVTDFCTTLKEYIFMYLSLFDEVDNLGDLLLLQDNNFRDSISDLSYVSHDTCQTNIDTNTCTNGLLICLKVFNTKINLKKHLL